MLVVSTSMQPTYPTLNVLKRLIGICKDGQEGFALAKDDATAEELRELFARMSEERRKFAEVLQELLVSIDADPDDAGTSSGRLHRWLMDIEAVLTGANQHAMLVECEHGEDAAVVAYQNALAEDRLPDKVRAVTERQSDAVKKAHDIIRALRDSIL